MRVMSSFSARVIMVVPPTSTNRRELEVQPLQTAQHVRVRVALAAGTDRSVRLLGDPDVGQAVEQPIRAGDRLRPGERRARAAVDARPERDVLAVVRTPEAEVVRILELARVAV